MWDDPQAEGVEHGKLCSRTDLEAEQLEGGSEGREPLLRPPLASQSCHLHPGGLVEEAAEAFCARQG